MTTATSGDIVVDVEKKPGSQVEIRVEAPSAELDRAVDVAVRRIARGLRIPGFRPGKAPAPVVERTVGWDAVRREAIEELIPSLYVRAVEQAGLEPVGDPNVESFEIERHQPVKFTATVTVRPDVDLRDYLSMRVDEPRTEVGDKEVDEAVEEVRRRHAELRDVSRPAQSGDVLRCVLVMRRGEEVLSGPEEERDLELDRERLLPGLADALVGLSAGDEHGFDLTLPEDYSQEDLRGASVHVEARIVTVRERDLPAVDDELAKKDGNAETAEAMREHYRTLLEENARRHDEEHFEQAVLEAFRDSVAVDVPEVMVDSEIDRQVREMELQLAQMGLQFDKYLEYTGTDLAQFRGERREPAAQRVKLQLALDALADSEGLEVEESQVEREEERLTAGRKLTADQRHRIHHAAHADLTRRAAVDRLLEIARGQA